MPNLTLRVGAAELAIVTPAGSVPADMHAAQSLRSIEIVLLGLGMCTVATLRHYFERKGLPIEGLILDLSAELDEPENLYDRLRVELALPGAIPDSLHPIITNVARTCRIHKTLSRANAITVAVLSPPSRTPTAARAGARGD